MELHHIPADLRSLALIILWGHACRQQLLKDQLSLFACQHAQRRDTAALSAGMINKLARAARPTSVAVATRRASCAQSPSAPCLRWGACLGTAACCAAWDRSSCPIGKLVALGRAGCNALLPRLNSARVRLSCSCLGILSPGGSRRQARPCAGATLGGCACSPNSMLLDCSWDVASRRLASTQAVSSNMCLFICLYIFWHASPDAAGHQGTEMIPGDTTSASSLGRFGQASGQGGHARRSSWKTWHCRARLGGLLCTAGSCAPLRRLLAAFITCRLSQ